MKIFKKHFKFCGIYVKNACYTFLIHMGIVNQMLDSSHIIDICATVGSTDRTERPCAFSVDKVEQISQCFAEQPGTVPMWAHLSPQSVPVLRCILRRVLKALNRLPSIWLEMLKESPLVFCLLPLLQMMNLIQWNKDHGHHCCMICREQTLPFRNLILPFGLWKADLLSLEACA